MPERRLNLDLSERRAIRPEIESRLGEIRLVLRGVGNAFSSARVECGGSRDE
jgi:hypothetical protein